jgi:hypothetical protein
MIAIAQFSVRLICGMSLMWCLMPRSQVTCGFFRIQMLVALGLSVLAALTLGEADAEIFNAQHASLSLSNVWLGCWGLAGAAFFGSILWTLQRRLPASLFVFLIAAAAGSLLLGMTPVDAATSRENALRLVSELSSALLLGGAVTGMLLGHWYLTAPTMSIAPLNRLTFYFGGAAVFRLALSAIALALAWQQLSSDTHLVWLGLRWLAGILGPLAVFVATWRILKYRNTQAATGVLFVGVILSFIGEMTASLLFSDLRMPL